MQMSKERPVGITVIALLLGLGAVLSLCGSLAQLGVAPLAIFGSTGLGGAVSDTVSGVYGIVVAVAELVVAFGLWTLQPWAFWVTVVVEGLALVGAFLSYRGRVGFICGSGLLPLIVLGYMFLDRNVRAAFRT